MDGCSYEGTASRVRLHVERKRDTAHVKYREEQGVGQRALEAPAPAEASPGPGAEPGKREEGPAGSASEIAVDFGSASPVVEPLLQGPAPEVEAPPAEKPAETPRPEPAGEPPAERALPVVIEDEPAGPASVPAVQGAPAPVPTLGMAMQSPHMRGLVNRFALGATNRWLIDTEKGDTPVSREEIEALNLPETMALTLDWLEKKYGWRFELDHPLVWWAVAVGMFAQTVSAHRAERKGEDEEEALPEPVRAPAPAPPAPPSAPKGPLDAALEEATV